VIPIRRDFRLSNQEQVRAKLTLEKELRTMRRKTVWMAAVISVFLPMIAAQAQDVDVPGNLTMVNSTATEGNILKGGVPFIHNYGYGNTFLGENAGNLTMTGNSNTGCGRFTLFNNTNGASNTANGSGGLYSNTTGSYNTANGAGALYNNTTGDANTASGYAALSSNTTGGYNSALGREALLRNTTGNSNTAVGSSALVSNTSGSNNTASGSLTLLFNTTGNGNTATGYSALHDNSTGGFNTATGREALSGNTSGNNNTASGFQALFRNTDGSGNTASGENALYSNTGGVFNTASGLNALSINTTGSFNTALGTFANVSVGNLNNATAIGYNAVVDASNKVRVGNTDVTVIEGQVAFTFTSDKTKKENFKPVDGEEALAKIRGLNLTSWNYIGQDPKQFRHYGPMAQDFFAAFGQDGIGTIGTPTTLNSGDLDGILMVAAQTLERRTEEQKKEIVALRKETRALKARNAALETQLTALERRVGNHALTASQ
jgi:trimeric autotransporter adhesin